MTKLKLTKKLLMLAVALVMLFTAAFFCCNTNLTALAQGEPTAEEVDDYLRDNGYSEEFIAMTGEQTKLRLYQENAVFLSESIISQNEGIATLDLDTSEVGQDWEGFSGRLTASEVTAEKEGFTAIMLTFNWHWQSDMIVYHDIVAIAWGDDFDLIPESPFFELYGTGTKVFSHIPNPMIPELPEEATGPFMTLEGNKALSQLIIGEGVAFRIDIDYETWLFKREYVSGSYAMYEMDPNEYFGTYSVTIQRGAGGDGYANALANYFHLSEKTEYDFSFSIGISKTPFQINVDPDIVDYFMKSADRVTDFYY